MVSKWLWPGNRTFLEVVTWWIVAFLHSVILRYCTKPRGMHLLSWLITYVHIVDCFWVELKVRISTSNSTKWATYSLIKTYSQFTPLKHPDLSWIIEQSLISVSHWVSRKPLTLLTYLDNRITKWDKKPKGNQPGDCRWPLWSCYRCLCDYTYLPLPPFKACL